MNPDIGWRAALEREVRERVLPDREKAAFNTQKVRRTYATVPVATRSNGHYGRPRFPVHVVSRQAEPVDTNLLLSENAVFPPEAVAGIQSPPFAAVNAQVKLAAVTHRCEIQASEILHLISLNRGLEVAVREKNASIASLSHSKEAEIRATRLVAQFQREFKIAEREFECSRMKVADLGVELTSAHLAYEELRAKFNDLNKSGKALEKKIFLLCAQKAKLGLTVNSLRANLSKHKKRESRARNRNIQQSSAINTSFVKSFDNLTDARSKTSRYEAVVHLIEKVCLSSDESTISDFVKQFSSWYGNEKPSPSLTPIESFAFMRQYEISWGRYAKMRRVLEKICGQPILASVRVQKQSNLMSKKEWYKSFVSEVTVKGKKVRVNTLELTDLGGMLKSRLQNLSDSGKLRLGAEYNNKLWITVIADKGGPDTRLCLQIGNIDNANSRNSLLLCGAYAPDDKREYLSVCLKNVIAKINSLKTVQIEQSGADVDLQIEWFLSGDRSFLYSCMGNMGQSTTQSCLFCPAARCPKISEWDCDRQQPPRTLSSYKADAPHGTNGVRENFYPIFTCIDVDHIIPPSLHVLMGCADFAFDGLRSEATLLDANFAGQFLTKQEQKAHVTALKKKLKELRDEKKLLEQGIKVANLVRDAYVAIQTNTLPNCSAKSVSESVCSADICVMRDKKLRVLKKIVWIQCAVCSKYVHYECAGLVSAESIQRATSDDYVCMDCEGLDLIKRLSQIEQELSHLVNAFQTIVSEEADLVQELQMAPIRYFGANKINSVRTNNSNVFKDLHSAKATIEEERHRRVKADERGDEYKAAKKAAEKEYRIVEKSLMDCEEELVVSKKSQEVCEKALALTREELEKSQSAFVECRNALAAKDLELSELSNQSVASKKREEKLKEQLERMSRSKSAHKGACREERGLKEQAESKLEKVKAKANLRIRQLTDRNKNLTSRCGILAENQSTVDRDEVFLEAKRLYESDVEKMENQVEKMEKELIDSKAKHGTAEARAERMKKRADMADADTNARQKEVDHHIRRYRSIFRALRCFVDKQRQLRREGAILVDGLKEHLDPAGLTHYQDVFAPVHQEMFDGPVEDSGEDGVQREMRNSDDWYDSDELEEQDDLED